MFYLFDYRVPTCRVLYRRHVELTRLRLGPKKGRVANISRAGILDDEELGEDGRTSAFACV